MDKNGKKVVAFSFFDDKEDFREIKSLLKNSLPSTQGWEKAKKEGKTPSITKFTDEAFMSDDFRDDIDKYWRPSTALALSLINEGINIDEYHLIFQPKWGWKGFQEKTATYIKEAIKRLVAPSQIKIFLHPIDIGNGHDFETVYCALYDYFQDYLHEHKEEHNSENRPRYLVHVTSGSQATRMCLFLLAQNRWIPAECVQIWADDKKDPIGKCSITNPVLSSDAYKELTARRKKESEDNQSILKQHIKTQDKKYNRIIEEIEKIATITEEPILLLGDTGVGKSEIAKQISKVRETRNMTSGEIVHFNCSGVKGALVDSILFGHDKGAFTDATEDKVGIIELANNRVLFLDEIGNLPWETQGKLLTVLDTHRFNKLGDEGNKIESKFFLICATNEDLALRVEENTFRRDLFERIRTWTFTIPSLAERKDDLAPNIAKELEKFETEYGRHVSLEGQPLDEFLKYVKSIPLKGNFRELRRMIWHMATFATLAGKGAINVDLVNDEISRHEEESKQSKKVASSVENVQDTKSERTMATKPRDAKDLVSQLLQELHVNETEIDGLILCQLRYTVGICCEESVKSAADAGRKIASSRLYKSKAKNANNILANFFNRKEIKGFNLSFQKIKEEADRLRHKEIL